MNKQITEEALVPLTNPTAHEIRAARDIAEGEILEAVRKFERASGCRIRGDVKVMRVCAGPVADISTPVVMLDVDLGPTSRRLPSFKPQQEQST